MLGFCTISPLRIFAYSIQRERERERERERQRETERERVYCTEKHGGNSDPEREREGEREYRPRQDLAVIA